MSSGKFLAENFGYVGFLLYLCVMKDFLFTVMVGFGFLCGLLAVVGVICLILIALTMAFGGNFMLGLLGFGFVIALLYILGRFVTDGV